MNKILVKLYVPMIEKCYDVWIPLNKSVYNIINLLAKAVDELNKGIYKPSKLPNLYNRATAEVYDINLKIKETNMKNGTEIVLI